MKPVTPCTPAFGRNPACLAMLLAVLLAACAGPPPAPKVEKSARATPQQALAQGDYARAARLWEREAGTTTGTEASRSHLQAGEAWLLADRPDDARRNLELVGRDSLAASEQARLDLALADLALRNGQPAEAEALLRRAQAGLPDSHRERFNRLRDTAAAMTSRPASGDLTTAGALSRSLKSYDPQAALALIKSLEGIPSAALAREAAATPMDPTLAAWLDLALVIRRNLATADLLEAEVTDWKLRHPLHWLEANQALELWLLYRQEFRPPARVAVLLPLSGGLAGTAEAIRDGLLSAYLDAPGGAEIFFIDSGEDEGAMAAAYAEARAHEADWIIGPLQKPSIEALLSLPEFATPLLALNDLPATAAPPGLQGRLYGMSLSQDEEARALVRFAQQAGSSRAIVLAPENEWGERLASVFQDEFLHEDRKIVVSARYPEAENDHSAVLERLLKIDESKARKQALENVLQMPLEFEPVRRDDVDVILLAAEPAQGRLLRPQLRFHGAGDVPVYASRRIWSGRMDPARDQDLDGVRLPAAPLELAQGSDDTPLLRSLHEGTMTALHALGRDAWNVLPFLELMRGDPDFRFAGASGFYRVAAAGHLAREPALAEFKGGVPVAIEVASGETGPQ